MWSAKRPTPRPRHRRGGAHELARVPKDEAGAELAEAKMADEELEAAAVAVCSSGTYVEAETKPDERGLIDSIARGGTKGFVVDVELD